MRARNFTQQSLYIITDLPLNFIECIKIYKNQTRTWDNKRDSQHSKLFQTDLPRTLLLWFNVLQAQFAITEQGYAWHEPRCAFISLEEHGSKSHPVVCVMPSNGQSHHQKVSLSSLSSLSCILEAGHDAFVFHRDSQKFSGPKSKRNSFLLLPTLDQRSLEWVAGPLWLTVLDWLISWIYSCFLTDVHFHTIKREMSLTIHCVKQSCFLICLECATW